MSTLKDEREKRGWSQAELARRASLNAGTLSMIERGKLQAYPVQVEKLARAMGISQKKCREMLVNSIPIN
jgi:excisionase family DNA binding protein